MRPLTLICFLSFIFHLSGCGFFQTKKSLAPASGIQSPSESELARQCEAKILFEQGLVSASHSVVKERVEVSAALKGKNVRKKAAKANLEIYATMADEVVMKLLKPGAPLHIYVEEGKSKQIAGSAISPSGVFVSSSVFSRVGFENELAFILARALVSARTGVGFQCIWDGTSGTLRSSSVPITETQNSSLDLQAIRMIYDAHYDPRSAISVVMNIDSMPSPRGGKFDPNEIRLQMVRQEIARLSPLRDPILSGERFKEMRLLLKP